MNRVVCVIMRYICLLLKISIFKNLSPFIGYNYRLPWKCNGCLINWTIDQLNGAVYSDLDDSNLKVF